MTDRIGLILGEKKTALAGAVQSEDSVVRQTRQGHRSGFDRRLYRRQHELMVRKAQRSDARIRGAGFGRRPILEAAA